MTEKRQANKKIKKDETKHLFDRSILRNVYSIIVRER